jgi:hypothetical protein
MISENPPSRLRKAEEDQASDTATTARDCYALRRHLADSPDRETARPLIKSRVWRAIEEPP